MSADLLDQLARYGDVLREEVGRCERLRDERPAGADLGADAVVDPGDGRERSWWNRRPSQRLLLVAATLLAAVASGVALFSLRAEPVDVAAVPVEDPALLDRGGDDPPEFVERLDDVDFEATVAPGRELTEGELADAIDFFSAGGGIEVRSAEISFVLDDDRVVVDAVTTVTDDAGGDGPDVGSELQCRVVAQTDGTSLEFGGWGFSCWEDGAVVMPEVGEAALFSYGCRPAIDIVGLIVFGKGEFVAEFDLPPDSPGVIVTLLNGDEVLVRPLDQHVFFVGPVAAHIDVFYDDGGMQRITTSDCR